MTEQEATTAAVLLPLLGFIGIEFFYRIQLVALMALGRIRNKIDRKRQVQARKDLEEKLLEGYLVG